jgi:hypothetical protein
MTPEQEGVTVLLHELSRGNQAAFDQLMPVVYVAWEDRVHFYAVALQGLAAHVSPPTVHRELRMAKAWLHRELTQSS